MATTQEASGEWTKRSVVSSFLMRFDGPKPQVALFQRSNEVSTYRNHLAPISGSINPNNDPSPLAAAWREISEETTLTPASLSLLRQGKPYTFRDASVRREWTVYPFLFRLKETPTATTAAPGEQQQQQGIVIDWEHDAWGWFDPDEVIRTFSSNSPPDEKGAKEGGMLTLNGKQLKGVPRLAESLRRVWFETDLGPAAGRVLSDGLEALARDHESGARQLAGAALRTLRGVVAELDTPPENKGPIEEWWINVRFAAWHLWKNGRESMGAAIMSALLAALAGVEETVQKVRGAEPWREAVLQELDNRVAARQESAKLVSRAFASFLEKTFPSKLASHHPISILTLSESSTIRQALRHAAFESGFVLDLHILESRPLYEGVSLAGGLADDLATASSTTAQAHKITLYTDASAALASSGIDIVLLGADRIAASGAVSNKTGSLPAVLSAKHVSPSAKVVVLGEAEKIAPPGRPQDHVVEDNDPAQLSRAWQAEYNSERVRNAGAALQIAQSSADTSGRVKLEIRNVFFEWVPAGLIDAYVTEAGEWTGTQTAQHSEKLEAEKKRLFGGL